MNKMYYTKPSSGWIEGLPIGNGRLAAMVWGDDKKDVLTLNHEWLWRGEHRNRKVCHSSEHLEFVRNLLKERDFFRATEFANLYFGGGGGLSLMKNRVDAYQVAGELNCVINDCREFEYRQLDIENGIATTVRKTSKCRVVSEFLANCENNLLMFSWRSDNKEDFECTITLNRVEDKNAIYNFSVEKNKLVFDCKFIGGIKHRIVSEIQTDGAVTQISNSLNIKKATYINCITNIATSVINLEDELQKYSICFDDFEILKKKHKAKFSKIMNGVKLELEEDISLNKLPIEQRLSRVKNGERDNGIIVLYFNYGRYLLISSSICGDLPANLQGKWNDRIDPPWECDYHFDINLEMNYWMAEPCNMSQCADTLLKFIESFYESGKESAEKLYGCRGIYLPIQTDAWGISTPESFGWAVWIGAAPWIAQHFWNHYTYSGDLDYLKNRAYKYFKAVAEFYEDYLVEDEDGILQIMPSQSPENKFVGGGYLPVSICISSAMDVQLAYDALGYAIEAASILKIDAEKVQRWKKMRDKLPPFKIGKDGRLLEWNEEKEECPDELGHRHLSHLYGVYPSSLFTEESRTEQYRAAKKSLEFRLSHGGGHTGWSRAWVSCLYARFGDSERFYENFIALIRDFATITLLDLHPPGVFQIDGNLGAVAALIESIVSFTDNKIHLLRSLPKEWNSGCLCGIKVPGGHIIDVSWKNGIITDVKLQLGYSGSAIVCGINGEEKHFDGNQGEIITIFRKTDGSYVVKKL